MTIKTGNSLNLGVQASLIFDVFSFGITKEAQRGEKKWVTGNGETHTSAWTQLCDALTVPPGSAVNGD